MGKVARGATATANDLLQPAGILGADGKWYAYGEQAAQSTAPFSIIGTISGATTLTRPANTTAYTAGDEVSNNATQASAVPFVFANAALAVGGGGRITKVRLQASDPLCVSAIFRLYLFDTTPTMVGDNSAYALLASEFATRKGYIDIGPLVTSVGTGVAEISHDVAMDYLCAAADTSLYGVLVIQNSYTPLNAGTFRLTLTVRRG